MHNDENPSKDLEARAESLRRADEQLGQARTNLDIARKRVDRLLHDVEMARSNVADARLALESIEAQADHGRASNDRDVQTGLETLERQFSAMIYDALFRKEGH